MTDEVQIQTMKLLDRIVFCSYLCARVELFSLTVYRMIHLVLKQTSAVALAYFGVTLSENNVKVGRDALSLMETLQSRSKRVGCLIIFTVHVGILPRGILKLCIGRILIRHGARGP
jgi:hypothetical protein